MAATFTDANFDAEVKRSAVPVLVDFTATWCGPCKMLAPVIEDLAREYAGRVKIGKLDIDENRATAQSFGVMSVPTLYFFKDGEVADQLIGAVPKPQITAKLDALL